MGENRMELSFVGGSDIFTSLTGFGCMIEIIQFKRRAFIPVGAQGPSILAKVLERFPLDQPASGRIPGADKLIDSKSSGA